MKDRRHDAKGHPATDGRDAHACRKGRRKKLIFCLIPCLLLIGTAGYFAGVDRQKDRDAQGRFGELAEAEAGREAAPAPAASSLPEDKKGREKKKEEANPDWIGWLKIRGTTISYPVMQRKGDSEYYLHRDFDGNYSFYGTPFLDIRCDTGSDNCFIYGHNINGGRMFGALHKYAGQDYYLEHPDMKVRFGEEKRSYEIVSVIQTTTASELYSFTDTGNWEEYRDSGEKILNGSLYPTKAGEEVRKEMERCSLEDFFRRYRFVSLSTCRSWVGKDARLLVIGAAEQQEMRGENENG
ncbi:MAG: class B sortase [Lachnospiraceae bacterium]|nr:class B sortase [Lachnospiraceae bacterium]